MLTHSLAVFFGVGHAFNPDHDVDLEHQVLPQPGSPLTDVWDCVSSGKADTVGITIGSVVRELLRGVFCVPKRAKGVKPFVDWVIGVFNVDEKIWIRVYEIREAEGERKAMNADDLPSLPDGTGSGKENSA